MLIRSFTFGLSLVLAASAVSAADLQPWYKEVLKQDNPSDLSFSVSQSECGLVGQLEPVVEGVLVRSRVKPMKFRAGFHLTVNVACLDSGRNQYPVYSVIVNFSNIGPGFYIHYGERYAFIGIGPKQDMFDGAKRQVERAMTDYISANFNL